MFITNQEIDLLEASYFALSLPLINWRLLLQGLCNFVFNGYPWWIWLCKFQTEWLTTNIVVATAFTEIERIKYGEYRMIGSYRSLDLNSISYTRDSVLPVFESMVAYRWKVIKVLQKIYAFRTPNTAPLQKEKTGESFECVVIEDGLNLVNLDHLTRSNKTQSIKLPTSYSDLL